MSTALEEGLALMAAHFAMEAHEPGTVADKSAASLQKDVWPAVVKWFEEQKAINASPEDMTDALIGSMALTSAAVVCCIADMIHAPRMPVGGQIADAISNEMKRIIVEGQKQKPPSQLN